MSQGSGSGNGINQQDAWAALAFCLDKYFHATIVSLIPSAHGKSGSITVTEAKHGPENPITIFNDVTSFNKARIKRLAKKLNFSHDPIVAAFYVKEYIYDPKTISYVPSGFSPYRNYTVGDFGHSPISYLNAQTHETANSLSDLSTWPSSSPTGWHYLQRTLTYSG